MKIKHRNIISSCYTKSKNYSSIVSSRSGDFENSEYTEQEFQQISDVRFAEFEEISNSLAEEYGCIISAYPEDDSLSAYRSIGVIFKFDVLEVDGYKIQPLHGDVSVEVGRDTIRIYNVSSDFQDAYKNLEDGYSFRGRVISRVTQYLKNVVDSVERTVDNHDSLNIYLQKLTTILDSLSDKYPDDYYHFDSPSLSMSREDLLRTIPSAVIEVSFKNGTISDFNRRIRDVVNSNTDDVVNSISRRIQRALPVEVSQDEWDNFVNELRIDMDNGRNPLVNKTPAGAKLRQYGNDVERTQRMKFEDVVVGRSPLVKITLPGGSYSYEDPYEYENRLLPIALDSSNKEEFDREYSYELTRYKERNKLTDKAWR